MSNYTKAQIDFVNNEAKKGSSRSKIEGGLRYKFDFTVKQAKDILNEVLGKSARSSSSWEETIKVIRENYGKLEKDELIKKMMEVKGGKYSSMNHAYNYIKFAQEYAKQELEAYKASQGK